MHRVLRAVVGGIAGTALMSLVFLMAEVETRFLLGVPAAIARFAGVPGRYVLGAAIFVVAGVVAWPVLFVVLEPYLGRLPGGEDAAVSGMYFAVLLWVAFLVPGTGSLVTAALGIYLVVTLGAHLVYGFTLGALYARLDETTASPGRADASPGS